MSIVNKCPRCKKTVYAAEEAIGGGQHWHKMCFSCLVCKKGLDSTTLADKDGEIYCRSCHSKSFGIKGYGFGGGAGVLSMDGPPKENKQQGVFCGECGAANQSGKFCGECGKSPTPANPDQTSMEAQGQAGSELPVSSTSPVSSPNGSSRSFGGSNRSSQILNIGGGDVCPRCSKRVYHAEKAIGAGKNWHKRCFSCKDCKKGLDSDTLADKDGEIFCRACHGKNFGPKGYGYGGGAGALKNTS